MGDIRMTIRGNAPTTPAPASLIYGLTPDQALALYNKLPTLSRSKDSYTVGDAAIISDPVVGAVSGRSTVVFPEHTRVEAKEFPQYFYPYRYLIPEFSKGMVRSDTPIDTYVEYDQLGAALGKAPTMPTMPASPDKTGYIYGMPRAEADAIYKILRTGAANGPHYIDAGNTGIYSEGALWEIATHQIPSGLYRYRVGQISSDQTDYRTWTKAYAESHGYKDYSLEEIKTVIAKPYHFLAPGFTAALSTTSVTSGISSVISFSPESINYAIPFTLLESTLGYPPSGALTPGLSYNPPPIAGLVPLFYPALPANITYSTTDTSGQLVQKTLFPSNPVPTIIADPVAASTPKTVTLITSETAKSTIDVLGQTARETAPAPTPDYLAGLILRATPSVQAITHQVDAANEEIMRTALTNSLPGEVARLSEQTSQLLKLLRAGNQIASSEQALLIDQVATALMTMSIQIRSSIADKLPSSLTSLATLIGDGPAWQSSMAMSGSLTASKEILKAVATAENIQVFERASDVLNRLKLDLQSPQSARTLQGILLVLRQIAFTEQQAFKALREINPAPLIGWSTAAAAEMVDAGLPGVTPESAVALRRLEAFQRIVAEQQLAINPSTIALTQQIIGSLVNIPLSFVDQVSITLIGQDIKGRPIDNNFQWGLAFVSTGLNTVLLGEGLVNTTKLAIENLQKRAVDKVVQMAAETTLSDMAVLMVGVTEDTQLISRLTSLGIESDLALSSINRLKAVLNETKYVQELSRLKEADGILKSARAIAREGVSAVNNGKAVFGVNGEILPVISKSQAPQYVQEMIGYLEGVSWQAQKAGYAGGASFQNNPIVLPSGIYTEWDLFPQATGIPRGSQRLVYDSVSKRVYYTVSHYDEFSGSNAVNFILIK
jgi:hypothetical protein